MAFTNEGLCRHPRQQPHSHPLSPGLAAPAATKKVLKDPGLLRSEAQMRRWLPQQTFINCWTGQPGSSTLGQLPGY